MKTRPWILAVVAVSILTASLLALGSAPARISRPPGDARGKDLAPVSKALDLFASKQRPAAGKSAAADPARLSEVGRDMAARWRAFQERRAETARSPRDPSPQRAAYESLLEECGPRLRAYWDGETGLPIFVTGTEAASDAERDPRTSAARFLQEHASLLRLDDPDQELSFTRAETDAAGATHLRYQQTYRGLEIWGRDLVVHVGADGRVSGLNGRYAETPRFLGEPIAAVTAAEARGAAAREIGATLSPESGAPRLVVAPDQAGALRLAWLVPADVASDQRWEVFVDASSGEVIRRVSLVATDGPVAGSGTDLSNTSRSLNLYQVGSTFYLIDASKTMWNGGSSTPPQTVTGAIRIVDARNGEGQSLYFITSNSATSWTNFRNGVSASFFVSKVYDYFLQRHGRNSINASGGTIETIVNLGQNYNNAFWNGTFMAFGNGDGQSFKDLAGSLDVTGHEMTHGVVEYTANLVYEFQPGALNESMADVFGTAIEFYVEGAAGDWLLGEDVTTPQIANDCLRNMQNPAAANVAFGGQQPTTMSEYENLTASQDHGGVHVNSGIPNRAAYLIGSQIGVQKMEQIYYKALRDYLTRSSQFVDARLAVVQAATDLYGGSSAEANACRQAFDTVEISEGPGTDPPDDAPPIEGTEWIAMKGSSDDWIYRTNDFTNFLEIIQMPVFNKPTFTDDGQTMLFIDSDHDVWAAGADGSDATPLSSSGGWWSIAVSPDGSRIALTTDYADSSIYVIDLAAEEATRYYLAGITHDGATPTYPDYADFLDFSLDGEFVLFDAFYSTGLEASGVETWDISILRLADGKAFRVFGTPPAGTNIGNPVFASNNDSRIAFDFVAPDGRVTILGANLETGALATISENGTALGRPDFAPDDRSVVYEYTNQSGTRTVWTVSLEPDGITGSGDDLMQVLNAYDPTWYAVGSRTAVDLAYFEAEQAGAACEVRWGVYSEIDHAGYNLYAYEAGARRLLARGLREPASRGTVIAYRYTDLTRGVEPRRYLLEAVDRSGRLQTFGPITARVVSRPEPAALSAAAPNPFSRRTSFTVSAEGRATLRLFDASGRLVRELLRDAMIEGRQVVTWEGDDGAGRSVPSGVYFARLETAAGARVQRVVKMP